MFCLANALSVISSASNNKNKSLFTEQLGWGWVKGEKRPANGMFSSTVDGIQSPVLLTGGCATYQFSLIPSHIFFTPKTVKTTQNRLVFLHTETNFFFYTSKRNTDFFFLSFLLSFFLSFVFCVGFVYLCLLGAGVWKQVSRSLPGNVFIFLDPSSSLLRGGISPLLSPGPRGAL